MSFVSFMSLSQFDTSFFYSINHLPHNQVLNSIFLLIHYLTREGLIYVPFLLIFLFSKNRSHRPLAQLALVSTLLTYVVNDLLLKNIFARSRPFQILPDAYYLLPSPQSYSFPSGQSAIAFAIATMFLLFFPKKIKSYLALFFAFVVALDRIYMGHHYPFDVIVGAGVGIAISLIIFKYGTKFVTKSLSGASI
jgi:undecaprenyl-diphosphatase